MVEWLKDNGIELITAIALTVTVIINIIHIRRDKIVNYKIKHGSVKKFM